MAEVPDWLTKLVASLDGLDEGFWKRLMPEPPPDIRRSAVLVLFGEGEHGPDVLLIEKSPHLRTHAGQPAFPGGHLEPTDASPAAAALREAREEAGVIAEGVDVLTVLPEMWVPPSGNAVTPVIAWWREPSEVLTADPREVAAVARVPLSEFVDPANRLMVRHPSGFTSPAFTVAGMRVWGFTAGVLDRLLTVGGFAVPWDESRVEAPVVG